MMSTSPFAMVTAISKRLVLLTGVLLLLAAPCWLPAMTVRAQEETPAAGAPASHTIAPGETLSEIAKEYGIDMATLMLLNGITNADAIYAGQELRLPAGDQQPTAEARPDEEPTEETPIGTLETNALETAAPVTTSATLTGTRDLTGTAPSTNPLSADAEPAAELQANNQLRAGDPATVTTLNQLYTVRSGDTLGDIALSTGVSLDALRTLNRLPDAPQLVAGEELLLPATADDLRPVGAAVQVTVAPGDTLSQIAAAYNVDLPRLMQINGLSNPDSLREGQQLIIPARPLSNDDASAPSPGEAGMTTDVGPQRSGFYYYTVSPGHTLSEIARDFDTPPLAIMEYNNLPDEQTVYAGLELRIPYGPPPLPQELPPGPLSGTSFLVSLSRQQCWLFDGAQVAESWNCSTGYGDWITRTGTFYVQTKQESARSGAYRLDMPYWLGLYDVGEFENGIHGLPVSWETGEKLWDGLIGQPATFGCAMLDDVDAAVLFARAYLGMPVHIVQ